MATKPVGAIEAMEELKEPEELQALKLGHGFDKSRLVMHVGVIHEDIGNYDEALRWYERALEQQEKTYGLTP